MWPVLFVSSALLSQAANAGVSSFLREMRLGPPLPVTGLVGAAGQGPASCPCPFIRRPSSPPACVAGGPAPLGSLPPSTASLRIQQKGTGLVLCTAGPGVWAFCSCMNLVLAALLPSACLCFSPTRDSALGQGTLCLPGWSASVCQAAGAATSVWPVDLRRSQGHRGACKKCGALSDPTPAWSESVYAGVRPRGQTLFSPGKPCRAK